MANQEYNKTFLRADSLEDAQDALQEVNEANPDAVIIVEEEGKECIIEHGKQLNFVPSDVDLRKMKENQEQDLVKITELQGKLDGVDTVKGYVEETLEKVGFEKVEVLAKEEEKETGYDAEYLEIPTPLKEGDVISIYCEIDNSKMSDDASIILFIGDLVSASFPPTITNKTKLFDENVPFGKLTTFKTTLRLTSALAKPVFSFWGNDANAKPVTFRHIVIAKGDTPISWEESENLEDSYNSPYVTKNEAEETYATIKEDDSQITELRIVDTEDEPTSILTSEDADKRFVSLESFNEYKKVAKPIYIHSYRPDENPLISCIEYDGKVIKDFENDEILISYIRNRVVQHLINGIPLNIYLTVNYYDQDGIIKYPNIDTQTPKEDIVTISSVTTANISDDSMLELHGMFNPLLTFHISMNLVPYHIDNTVSVYVLEHR